MSSVRSISSTARAGNVLVLLDLYASGFASSTTSPTIPMLTSRTMHALYAISLLVYSLNSFLNWVHIYFVLHGSLSSFPLHFWLAVLFAMASISGTMLIILLMMLCVENAFAHRLDITVHKNGLSLLIEAFLEWLYGFNNFRVAFLFMFLHDAPITLANFFLLGACRCGGPNVLRWPLLLSSLAIGLSLCWRLVLLRFAYARLFFRSSSDSNSAFPSRSQSFRHQFVADPCTTSQNEVNDQLDEQWAIRSAKAIVYGEKGGKCCEGSAGGTVYLGETENGGWGEGRSVRQCCGFWSSWVLLKGFDFFCAFFRRLCCLFLSLFLCAACLCVGCIPCLHHYTCSRNSFSHRHKCAKSFVHHCSLFFHYAVFSFSLCFSALLILLNVLLIFSTQLVGPSQWPPEISRLCISINAHYRIVRPLFLPESTTFSSSSIHPYDNKNGTVADRYPPLVQCKPLWDLPHQQTMFAKWAPGLSRMSPSPWQSRFPLHDGRVLAVSTHFMSDHSEGLSPRHTLFYDFALLTFGADNSSKTTSCASHRFSGWLFANVRNDFAFPYFWACAPTISIRKGELINCQNLTNNRKTHAKRKEYNFNN